MSTLRTNNIKNESSASNNIVLDSGGGIIVSGISTFSSEINLGTGTTISSPASNEFSISTNGSERVNIDSSGRVTMPYQPSFSAYGSASQVVSSAGWTKATIWGGEHFDTGNNFASDRFTAPVTGRYLFGTNLRVDNIGSDYWRVLISKNGTTSVNTNGHSLTRYEVNGAGSYHTMAVTAFFSLAANDYVEVYVYSNNDTSYTIHQESQFWGHLVG